MSGPEKRAREEHDDDGAGGGAASPGAHETPTLLDVAWIVAKNGYAADVWRCFGICRKMWRWIAPKLSKEDAARVRRDHPFWQAIINVRHGPDGRTRLMLAARLSKLAQVEALIAWHADVNLTGLRCGVTALINTSAQGHVEVVRALLAAGAEVNAADNAGKSALIWASYKGRVEIVRAMLAAGAGVDAATDLGYTALINASDKGHVEVVRVLLAAGAGVDAASNAGDTALMWASANGQVEFVRALLAAGASKHIVSLSGTTAFSAASYNPASTAAIRELLAFAP